MGVNPQKQAAKKFVEYWTFNRPGSEKSGCQQYWNMLLGELLGMDDLASSIRYEVPVQVGGTRSVASVSTKYLDVWIPSTRVLIEQKSRGVKLDAPQPGHDNMTPFEQAKFYDDHRPFDEKARWIITCNFDEIWIYDQTKPLEPPEKIALGSLPKEVHRLAFLVNTEVKKVAKRELEISVQAGKIVGTLYDALLKQYAEPESPETLKALNKLCVRLVFCFYAEDADIFDKNIFQKLVTATPADKLRRVLLTLFQVLDTPTDKRDKYLEPELAAFPYTNGGLYKDATEDEIPPMTEEIKKLLVSSSEFDWNGINTTIFGALFESTLNPETRRAGGMVYTSSENIHKLIDPLFLDELEHRFKEIVGGTRSVASTGRPDATKRVPPVLSKSQRKALLELQDYIASLLFLDPASGSGNFLTETYTSLRRLENKIIAAIQGDQPELDLGLRVKVSINQFHGIEINDFAVTVAKTAMWITEAKMARETAEILHRDADFLPLKDYDGIVEGNALRMDWATLLRRTGQVPEARFNYIIGNPPFVGARNKSPEQAKDVESVFSGWKNNGNLDYVTCWYKKAADYMIAYGRTTHAAFVSTNSICQGDGVATLWKPLFEQGVEIDFAWRTFRWDNESFEKARVHVVIVGFHCENRQAAAVRALVPVDASAAKQVQDKRELKDVFGRFGEVRNEDDGYAVRFSKEAAGKILRHRGFDQSRIASLLDVIYAKSLWAWDDAVRFEEGKKAHRNFLRYRNYIGKVSVGKSVYYVRFTITETIGDGNLVHSTFVSDVRVYDEGAGGLSIPDSNRAKVASAPLTDNRLANWFGAVKGGGEPKVIFDENGNRHEAKHINAYLTGAADVFVESRSKPLCDILEIGIGSQPIDDGNYLFTQEEKDAFLKTEPAAEKHVHPWLGSQEFLNNIKRYCLWLGDASPAELRAMPQCMARVKAVRKFRLASKRASTIKSAETPAHFAAENIPNEPTTIPQRYDSVSQFVV